MSSKHQFKAAAAPKAAVEDADPKPLATSLMQEFQNLKDKFKNDDENVEKGTTYSLVIFCVGDYYFFPFTILCLCALMFFTSFQSLLSLTWKKLPSSKSAASSMTPPSSQATHASAVC